jgi:prephenate dehydrogenase
LSGARLGIAGVGLIGGSIALRARGAYARIIGYDRDVAALARAQARGIIDGSAPDLISLATQCETLVIALPVDATLAALETLAGELGPRLVIDVASVKAPLVDPGGRVANFVGTHPMAGREQSGIEAADAVLFENATWAYAPASDAALNERARELIGSLGAVPLAIDPLEHDRIVALTSHLPQALSVLLGAELGTDARTDRRIVELCGPGMISMLRRARSPEAVWAPIVAANAAPLAARLRSIAQVMGTVAAALEGGESSALMSYFDSARQAAQALEERFPPSPRSSTHRSGQPPANNAPPPTR